jgi:hypothetical protein
MGILQLKYFYNKFRWELDIFFELRAWNTFFENEQRKTAEILAVQIPSKKIPRFRQTFLERLILNCMFYQENEFILKKYLSHKKENDFKN